MPQNLMVFDDTTGKVRRSSIATTDLPFFQDVTYVVTGPNVTEFPVGPAGMDITPLSKIDVFRNGQELVEGATNDYTRDPSSDKIITNYIIPQKSKVHIRVYG